MSFAVYKRPIYVYMCMHVYIRICRAKTVSTLDVLKVKQSELSASEKCLKVKEYFSI